ncbi:hypothetical protein AWN65_08140 [Flavobacterium covae]|nr:hypothetical protein AWN65_08140 [Flavobacterium covae]
MVLIIITLYNCIRKSNYNADGYLDGIDVVRQDYKELFAKYKDCPNVVFLVDPPYLSTDVSTYKGYWKLVDYLNVLNVLKNSNYFYFTSNKSQIIELCEWLETQSATLNPIFGAKIECVQGKAMYKTKYTDMMIYKQVS